MWNQETFKEWLPIDGQQYQTPFGIYTAHLVGEVEARLSDHDLCYLFRLTCPDAKDFKLIVRAYAEYFSAEERKLNALGIIALRIKTAEQSDIEVDFREETY